MKTTEIFAETIIMGFIANPAFDDALEDLRVSGGVLLNERYVPPLTIEIPDQQRLKAVMGIRGDVRIITFHLVRRGRFEIHQAGLPPCPAAADQVVICPTGQTYHMAFGPRTQPIPLTSILDDLGPKPPVGQTDATELVCGYFQVRQTPLNPLLDALPPVLKVATTGPDANPLLARAAEMLALEVAAGNRGSFTALRVLEIFCAEAIRTYQQGEAAHAPGWFKALSDPKIGAAIGRIHQDAGAPWSVAALGKSVAMSPSRFAARFRQTMGQSAMAYVAGWRLNVACRLLRESALSMGEIAAQVGYTDVAAFSRAFKARVGESPGQWRRIIG